MMKMCGYSREQIAQVATWQSSKLFDDKQRALLSYVEQTAHGGNVDDATFAALAKFFTPQEIVEITFTVGSYYGTGSVHQGAEDRDRNGRPSHRRGQVLKRSAEKADCPLVQGEQTAVL
jgi:hypothetical protein